ncbi:MAG TPA: DUF1330 domain-containing protein [Pseudolabrys sp.]|jgi:uncharacterized protein (DUF1330 family)|nr:DUF1330 domain-containing protein [Pseudolabrys sp.]
MAKGYWLARLDISDREVFAEYRKRNAAPLVAFGGKFIVKGGKADTMLGPKRGENVVVEFDSYDKAVTCFRSDEYQAAAQYLKRACSTIEFVIVEGSE